MKSAEAWLLRAARSLPGKLQLTSPLSQSKSGPTSSLSSAMNPSSETAAAPMIVFPMIPSFRVRAVQPRYSRYTASRESWSSRANCSLAVAR